MSRIYPRCVRCGTLIKAPSERCSDGGYCSEQKASPMPREAEDCGDCSGDGFQQIPTDGDETADIEYTCEGCNGTGKAPADGPSEDPLGPLQNVVDLAESLAASTNAMLDAAGIERPRSLDSSGATPTIAEVAYRTALETILQWDMINPPRTEVVADLAWLRSIVETALLAGRFTRKTEGGADGR